MVDKYYKKISRLVEYYILFCFISIIIFPLFEYSWVPGFIKFVYFTGFPLMLVWLFSSFIKDKILEILKNRFEAPRTPTSAGGKIK